MSGQRINIYVKNDFEKDAIKEFLKRYREDAKALKEVHLSPAQEEVLTTILKELNEIKKLLRPEDPAPAPVEYHQENNNFVDFDKQFALIDEE